METVREECEKLLSVRRNQENSNKSFICTNYLRSVNEKASTAEFLQDLFRCQGNADRVAVVSRYFKWTKLDPEIAKKYSKSSQISSLFRQLGNEARDEKRIPAALRLYSMALLFAPAEGPELGLAYACRSVALMELQLMEEAVIDTELALRNFYSKERVSELIKQKERYEKKATEKMSASRKGVELDRAEGGGVCSCRAQILTIKEPNMFLPAAADTIKLMHDWRRGRHIVVDSDIAPGTTVIVETPFVAALENALNWDVEHCHHCLRKCRHPIPCISCVFAVYCTEECRNEALEKYHSYECPCLPELHCNLQDSLLHNFYLVFKLICQLGPDQLYKRFITENSKKSVSNEYITGCDPHSGIYDPSSYETVYHLMSNINPKEGYYFVLISLIMSRTLAQSSTFYANIEDEHKKHFQDYITSLILHHFETFRRNLFSFEEIIDSDGVIENNEPQQPQAQFELKNFAVGVLPTMSLLNHSCDHNAVLVTANKFGTSAIVTVKPVKKGEELVISYGPHYGDSENTTTRQETLQAAYGFHCSCNACVYNWSDIILEQLSRPPHRPTEFLCPFCTAGSSEREDKRFTLVSASQSLTWACSTCGCNFTKSNILKEFYKYQEAVRVCERLICERRDPRKAISILTQALTYFELHCCPPCCYAVMAQKLLREAFILAVN